MVLCMPGEGLGEGNGYIQTGCGEQEMLQEDGRNGTAADVTNSERSRDGGGRKEQNKTGFDLFAANLAHSGNCRRVSVGGRRRQDLVTW